MIAITILAFILILGLLIFVHELGHFVMAKRAGMKVEEFGFGFPPRMFGIRRGETIYSINWIPLGGFVKILGEDGANDDPRAFINAGFWQKLAVLLAGVGMNFLLAWFVLFLAFAFIGTPLDVSSGEAPGNPRLSQAQMTVVAVQKDSPAEHAGLKAGDVILSINGQKFETIEELVALNKEAAGTQVQYELKRGEEILSRSVAPREEYPEGSGPAGFVPAKLAVATYPLAQAIKLSTVSFAQRITAILTAFGLLFKGLFTEGKVIEGLSGPVGIAVLTRDFVRLGSVYIAQFIAVLSINLAILNAVPFPALDGGRVLFLLIEKVRGSRAVKFEQWANGLGFLFLLLLMVVITVYDVGRFSEQFKRLFGGIF